MSLLDICEKAPPTVLIDATAADAIRAMLEYHVGAVTVVDSNRVVAGIFTERDVMRRLSLSGRDPHTTMVRDVMTTPVELATVLTSEAEALATMLERHYRHLPIVDSEGRLIGMLAMRHVLEARIDELVRQLERARTARIM